MCYFLDHDHTDLEPAVLATLKKLQDGYFGGARSDNEDISKYYVINNTYSRAVLAHLALNFARIQTGKLSEFLTTSCCARLSFLDSGKTRSMSSHGLDEDDDVEDSYFRGAMHDLNFSDGKGKEYSDKEIMFDNDF